MVATGFCERLLSLPCPFAAPFQRSATRLTSCSPRPHRFLLLQTELQRGRKRSAGWRHARRSRTSVKRKGGAGETLWQTPFATKLTAATQVRVTMTEPRRGALATEGGKATSCCSGQGARTRKHAVTNLAGRPCCAQGRLMGAATGSASEVVQARLELRDSAGPAATSRRRGRGWHAATATTAPRRRRGASTRRRARRNT